MDRNIQALQKRWAYVAIANHVLPNVLDYQDKAVYIGRERLLVKVNIICGGRRQLPLINSCTIRIITNDPDTIGAECLQVAQRQSMRLKYCERVIWHIGQRSMRLLFSAHTSGACGRYVTRNNLAIEHSIIGIHDSRTAVGHVLVSYNVLHELELGVFLTHNRYTTVHGVQICGSEAEGPQGYACNLYLCVDRCTVDIGT